MPWPYPFATGLRLEPARIDAWIPRGARKLEHHAIEMPMPPKEALAAIGGVELRDVPIVGALFAIRGIPFRRQTSLTEFFSTPPFVILEQEPDREVVFGVVGPFWQIRGRRLPGSVARTPAELRSAFDRGRMAAIGNFRAEPEGGGSRLWTETWVSAPGASQAALFTAYWLLIGPFSALIRRLLLGAARRRGLAAGRNVGGGVSKG